MQVKENTDIRNIDDSINNQYLFYVQSAQPLYSDYLTPPLAEHQQLLIDAHKKLVTMVLNKCIYSHYPGDHYAIDLGGPMHTTSVYNNNYFMAIIDVCTRFCILRALPDKRSDTILRSLIDVFSIIGFPTKL
ncbi:hypothetical protein G6F43_013073 [Rhizopus delemar]|nr:hypothetical protein G6F43_013073 [Rhizopus delemar]